MLEICHNGAGSTDIATDRRGHDGPSRTSLSHTCAIFSVALFITLNGKYDGSSQTRRSFVGLRSKTLKLLEYGYWDYFSKLHDEPAGRTVIDTTDRHDSVAPHLVRLPHLPSAAALRCHLQTVTSSVGGLFCNSSLKNLRIHLWTDFLQIMRNLYKN